MISQFSSEELRALREKYPPGSRITLKHMNDPYHPVAPCMTGTLTNIDDAGTVHVTWDNGRTLGLIFGEDSFHITPPVSKAKDDTLAARIRTVEQKTGEAPFSAPVHPDAPER